MSVRYERIPNPSEYHREDELEAAFDDDSDDDELHASGQAHDQELQRPLVARELSHPSTSPHYDFERVNYDYPPPGSPPRPSSVALPANAAYGNTNGLIPSSPVERPTLQQPITRPWLGRLIPFYNRMTSNRRSRGRVGGGSENDGVFANLMSKPTRARRVEGEDGIYLVPEETQTEPPPSYAAAQADAVPSYWETTIHAPSGGDVEGELVVDSLPTGSLFSFLWSMLVSVAFNFLGFVLTYLLHTTHAAKYGSRAGLGITLIQYGWALRTRAESLDTSYEPDNFSGDTRSSTASPNDLPTTSTWNNDTLPGIIQPAETYMLGESAAAWLSFSLMTIGWFLFLSSVLGFWRVKRWERGVLRAAPPPDHANQPGDSSENTVSLGFTFPGVFIREGLGLSGTRQEDEEEGQGGERFVVQEIDRQRQIAEVRINDVQLHRNLRAAGLI